MNLTELKKTETKEAIFDFVDAVQKTEVVKEQFFDCWATAQNQKEALNNAFVDDQVILLYEGYEFNMFKKMQAAIERELNAPFRCSEWKM